MVCVSLKAWLTHKVSQSLVHIHDFAAWKTNDWRDDVTWPIVHIIWGGAISSQAFNKRESYRAREGGGLEKERKERRGVSSGYVNLCDVIFWRESPGRYCRPSDGCCWLVTEGEEVGQRTSLPGIVWIDGLERIRWQWSFYWEHCVLLMYKHVCNKENSFKPEIDIFTVFLLS